MRFECSSLLDKRDQMLSDTSYIDAAMISEFIRRKFNVRYSHAYFTTKLLMRFIFSIIMMYSY